MITTVLYQQLKASMINHNIQGFSNEQPENISITDHNIDRRLQNGQVNMSHDDIIKKHNKHFSPLKATGKQLKYD